MIKNRIKTHWLLLLALLYTMFILLSIGETQARYINTVTWDTVVGESEDQLSSNLLRNVSEPPVTILLGEMNQSVCEVPILLQSGVDVEGELTWSVSPANHSDYLSVEMSTGNTVLSMDASGDEQRVMQLHAGEPVTVLMRLIPSKAAFSTSHEAMKVTVTVNWGNSLTGTFLAELPEIVQLDEAAQYETLLTEPTAEENMPEEETSSGNTAAPAAEVTVTEEETPAETPETSVPATDGTATEDGSSDTTGDSDSEPEVPPQLGEGTEGDSDTDSDSNTGEEDNLGEDTTPDTPSDTPSVDSEEIELEDVVIKTVEDGAAEEQVVLQIVLPNGSTFMRLGMGSNAAAAYETNSDPAFMLNEFPNYFCYSLDNGRSYYMLYHGGIIELETDGKTAVSVLVDFSRTKIDEETKLILAITAHDAQNILGTGVNAVTVEKTQNVSVSSRFLTKGTGLTIDIPQSWQAYKLEYEVEMLTADEQTGAIDYVKVEPQKIGLVITTNKATGAITVKTDKTLPMAGSYRICMNWLSGETCVEQAQEIFFVHYLDYMDTVKTGGAER